MSDIMRRKLITFIIMVIESVFILVNSGCSVVKDECDSFPEVSSSLNIDIYQLPIASRDEVGVQRALANIYTCSPKEVYMGRNFDRDLVAVRLYGDKYLMAFEVYGVEDLMIVFLANRNGDVVKYYHDSML